MFVNPSRAAPSAVRLSSDSQRFGNYALLANSTSNYAYATFTSVLAVTSCNFDSSSDIFRQICGLLCTQEYERFGAFFPAVFNEPDLYAQIYRDIVSITTRAKAKPKESDDAGAHCSTMTFHPDS
jgi:hypothetical protein